MGATANLLGDGQVLIAGGAIADGDSVATAELFDPKTGKFTPTAGVMNSVRAWHSSVYLPDGRIMIAGGGINVPVADAVTTATVDFYDPATGRFQAAAADALAARVLYRNVAVLGKSIDSGRAHRHRDDRICGAGDRRALHPVKREYWQPARDHTPRRFPARSACASAIASAPATGPRGSTRRARPAQFARARD